MPLNLCLETFKCFIYVYLKKIFWTHNLEFHIIAIKGIKEMCLILQSLYSNRVENFKLKVGKEANIQSLPPNTGELTCLSMRVTTRFVFRRAFNTPNMSAVGISYKVSTH